MQQADDRATQLRFRLYRVLGHGGIVRIAEDIGKNPVYISNILNGRGKAAPTLDLIESRLDEIERERKQAA